MQKQEHNIDLQCILCNKNPKFSDVSHLLTHISSKSHLAARFKLQIQAQSDQDAKNKLDHFDFWYRTSNIDTLLAERMAAKEHKKTKKSRNSIALSNASRENDQPSVPESIRSAPFIDTPVQGFRAPVPRMHLWPTMANNSPLAEWDRSPMSHVYETPTARRQVPNFGHQETPAAAKLDPKLTTPWKPDPEVGDKGTGEKSGQKSTDSAKLKGIIYPGMDLFDSATPEMKRMRNQKKDGTILEGMLATARDTEPAEISYHPNGDFRASRDIFGPLSTENSPKRKTRKTATALSNVSINAPRQRASRSKKATATRSPQKQQTRSMLAPPPIFFQPAPALNPLAAGFGRRFVPTTEEDEEFRLTIEDMGKKRGFNIFQDAPAISPARTEASLEDHGFDLPSTTHGLPLYMNESQNSSRFPISPTPVPKPLSYRLCGKENGKPDLPAQHQPARRVPSAPAVPSHGYTPQMFLNPSAMNPLYNHAYARSFGGFSQHTFTMTNVPMGYGSNFQGDFKPIGSMLQPQQQQGPGMGTKNNDFGNAMNYQ
ncbi:hypothetical protein N431DRAFT_322674 [Stipitochalara longipes BDJ]|nr:hypothetical protein N431DRAFT_322674 [Stipitochalara longipes BDJ]